MRRTAVYVYVCVRCLDMYTPLRKFGGFGEEETLAPLQTGDKCMHCGYRRDPGTAVRAEGQRSNRAGRQANKLAEMKRCQTTTCAQDNGAHSPRLNAIIERKKKRRPGTGSHPLAPAQPPILLQVLILFVRLLNPPAPLSAVCAHLPLFLSLTHCRSFFPLSTDPYPTRISFSTPSVRPHHLPPLPFISFCRPPELRPKRR